jgi:hypothetical protein
MTSLGKDRTLGFTLRQFDTAQSGTLFFLN